MQVLLITTIALFSSFFALGAVTILYLLQGTRILRLTLLFLSSLLLITLGFELRGMIRVFPNQADFLEALAALFQLPGVVLNMMNTPHFAAALLSYSFSRRARLFLRIWNGTMILLFALYPLLPVRTLLVAVLHGGLLLTILFSIGLFGAGIRTLQPGVFRDALVSFLWVSAGFFVLLVLDILITLLELSAFKAFDNLSLPLYFFGLNAGGVYFAGRFLNAPPLVQEGKLTEAACSRFALTEREGELIGKLMAGLTNQELAEALCISKKTVENHLYNIYQKMKVKNRMQLLQTLQNWKREI